MCRLRALAAVYLQTAGLRSVFTVRTSSISAARPCHQLKLLLGGTEPTGVCLNRVVLFNFLLMGLTDLISCLRGKDNLVANPLTLVEGGGFHLRAMRTLS